MDSPSLSAMLNGFGLGASLIIAIGAQNAFVLKQGLKGQFVLLVCSICFVCDAVLIALGAGGFGMLVASSPLLLKATLWGGAGFLLLYGLLSFRAALRPVVLPVAEDSPSCDVLLKVAITTLALTLLNPHVYLDTVLLLGSVAGQFPGKDLSRSPSVQWPPRLSGFMAWGTDRGPLSRFSANPPHGAFWMRWSAQSCGLSRAICSGPGWLSGNETSHHPPEYLAARPHWLILASRFL